MKTTTTTTRPRLKNSWGKTRPIDNPYLTIIAGEWEFRILKAYQTYANEHDNEHARWFCAVKSPYTYGTFEMGDTYVHDVARYITLEHRPALIARGRADAGV